MAVGSDIGLCSYSDCHCAHLERLETASDFSQMAPTMQLSTLESLDHLLTRKTHKVVLRQIISVAKVKY
jgi:hypothetical protein